MGNPLVYELIKYVLYFNKELNISTLHGWMMLLPEDVLLNTNLVVRHGITLHELFTGQGDLRGSQNNTHFLVA